MKRPCLGLRGEPACPELTTKTYCTIHARAKDALRGTRQQRGYDEAHQRARRYLAASLPAPCGYGCGTWLTSDGPWVAAHVRDGDPESPRIASCRGCNERAKRR